MEDINQIFTFHKLSNDILHTHNLYIFFYLLRIQVLLHSVECILPHFTYLSYMIELQGTLE
jgi:hypothetical protein